MTATMRQIVQILPGEILTAGINFTSRLNSTEVLGGTPTVVSDSTLVVISSPTVNATTTTILGDGVAVGKAVLFTITVGSTVATHSCLVTASSTSGGGQTVIETGAVKVL